jgi:hypothetical protein
LANTVSVFNLAFWANTVTGSIVYFAACTATFIVIVTIGYTLAVYFAIAGRANTFSVYYVTSRGITSSFGGSGSIAASLL